MSCNRKDLAPDIFRQRSIIEGITSFAIAPHMMCDYLKGLSAALDMIAHSAPSLSHHQEYGWCCHMHWVTSGAHMYTWENRVPCFFSVDIYTCKHFNGADAVSYTESFFSDILLDQLVYEEV